MKIFQSWSNIHHRQGFSIAFSRIWADLCSCTINNCIHIGNNLFWPFKKNNHASMQEVYHLYVYVYECVMISNTFNSHGHKDIKEYEIIAYQQIFISRGSTYPKVMHNVESGLLRRLIWRLSIFNWTYCSRGITDIHAKNVYSKF